MAELGAARWHTSTAGVPNIRGRNPRDRTQHAIGALLYFFEKACGISGYILGVNPFDQPGVEAYKKEYVRPAGQAGLRGGIESHQSTAVNSPGLWKCGTSHGVRD